MYSTLHRSLIKERALGLVGVLLLVGLCTGFAQDSFEPYKFPAKIPKEYLITPLQDYEEMLTLETNAVRPGQYRRFCEMVAYGKSRMFDRGHVYIGLDSLEDYLNQVLERIKPAKLPTNSKLHAYPAYAARYNAYAMHDGTLLVNIGLLADLQDEAALAIIMGHEISHHVNYDIFKGYKNKLKAFTKRNRHSNEAIKIKAAHKDRAQESQADSVGYVLASKAGYDLNSAYANYYRFMELEMEQEGEFAELDYDGEGSSEVVLQDELDTHPLTADRVKKLRELLPSLNPNNPAKYLVSESTFKRMRDLARRERLHIFLQYNHFEDCVLHAFKYYLMEPENEVYLYYLLEAIRRASFVESDFYQRGFLFQRYAKFLDVGKSILHRLELIFQDSSMYQAIQLSELVDTTEVEFETYGQAFVWFSQRIQEDSYPELFLSQALFYEAQPEKKQAYLRKYLDAEGGRFKNFAQAYKDDALLKNLDGYKRELVIMNDIDFLDDHFYGLHHNRIKEDRTRQDFMKAANKMVEKRFDHTQVVNLTQISRNNLDLTKKFERALLASLTVEKRRRSVADDSAFFVPDSARSTPIPVGEPRDGETIIFDDFVPQKKAAQHTSLADYSSKDLVLMNPEFWYIFEKNQLSRISYLQVQAFDNKAEIAGNAAFILLFPIYYYLTGDIPWLYSGSSRFFHRVEMYTYDMKLDKKYYYSHRIEYKLSKGHFLNAVYQAIHANKN